MCEVMHNVLRRVESSVMCGVMHNKSMMVGIKKS